MDLDIVEYIFKELGFLREGDSYCEFYDYYSCLLGGMFFSRG